MQKPEPRAGCSPSSLRVHQPMDERKSCAYRFCNVGRLRYGTQEVRLGVKRLFLSVVGTVTNLQYSTVQYECLGWLGSGMLDALKRTV